MRRDAKSSLSILTTYGVDTATTIRTLTLERDSLQSKSLAQNTHIASLNARYLDLSSSHQTLQAELNATSGQLKRTREDIKVSEAQRLGAEEEILRLKLAIGDMENEVEREQEDKARVQEEVVRLEGVIEDLKAQLEEATVAVMLLDKAKEREFFMGLQEAAAAGLLVRSVQVWIETIRWSVMGRICN